MYRVGAACHRLQRMPRAIESEHAIADAVGIRRQRVGPRPRPFARRPLGRRQRHDPIQRTGRQAGLAPSATRREFGLMPTA
ncbi:hypothetical protein G6F63_015449 [Rhizopus arrhizus]|nr:hypothetical protein G6F63_015449 [Rhizopus arrhizus]